jgi:hypothetical protein
MRKTPFTITIILLLYCCGCTQIPEFILYNNTSADIDMIYNGNVINIHPNSEHKLPNRPTYVDVDSFSAVIIRDHHRYGYQVNLEDLTNVEHSKNVFINIKYYLQLNSDGNIYLLRSTDHAGSILSQQPSGFPIKPILIE